jgi:hypothetical protein
MPIGSAVNHFGSDSPKLASKTRNRWPKKYPAACCGVVYCREKSVKAVSEETGLLWDTVKDLDKLYIFPYPPRIACRPREI